MQVPGFIITALKLILQLQTTVHFNNYARAALPEVTGDNEFHLLKEKQAWNSIPAQMTFTYVLGAKLDQKKKFLNDCGEICSPFQICFTSS